MRLRAILLILLVIGVAGATTAVIVHADGSCIGINCIPALPDPKGGTCSNAERVPCPV